MLLAGNQWRMTMAGPAGLDFGVIMEMAGIMDIEINQTFLEKLRAYESAVLHSQTKGREQ